MAAAKKTANSKPVTAKKKAPAKLKSAPLPFSEAIKVGNTLYVSGQVGNLPGTLKLAGGFKKQAAQAMSNVQAIVEQHGYAMDDIVKCTVMLANIKDWAAFNEIYAGYFQKRFPTRSAFAVKGLAIGAKVEVECIAAKGH